MTASGSPAISRQVAKAFGLARTPELADIYDDRFLPPREERMPLK